ncbi:Hypothetical predicted protein [Olea europaea subsp. europaea]|uniref:Uncharacterized protein n=1 Tax=Olea europaea subsp. europaea TaxID=158383 RepID=A0A8S0U4T6_OLEEU|nr:Hypothetical predicted protein [Olea europaea subsp. europaea]
MSISIDALALSGADYHDITVNFQDLNLADFELLPQSLLLSQNDDDDDDDEQAWRIIGCSLLLDLVCVIFRNVSRWKEDHH